MAAADDSDQLLHPIRPRVSDGRARVRRKLICQRMTDEVVLEARSSMCGSPMYGAKGRHEGHCHCSEPGHPGRIQLPAHDFAPELLAVSARLEQIQFVIQHTAQRKLRDSVISPPFMHNENTGRRDGGFMRVSACVRSHAHVQRGSTPGERRSRLRRCRTGTVMRSWALRSAGRAPLLPPSAGLRPSDSR